MPEYQLRYLPQFYKDLEQHIEYISEHLQNPKAANDLIDETEKAILERQPIAESFEQYRSRKERRYPYYCMLGVWSYFTSYLQLPT